MTSLRLNSVIEHAKALRNTLITMFEAAEAPTAEHALAVLASTAQAEADTAAQVLAVDTPPKGKALDSLLAAHAAGSFYLLSMLEHEQTIKSEANRHTVWDTQFRRVICSKFPEIEARFAKTHNALEKHRIITTRCKCSALLAEMKALYQANQ